MLALPCSELQAAWADIGSGGRAQRAEVVELLPEERMDQLTVEMHDGQGTLATGSISIATLWEARNMATPTTSSFCLKGPILQYDLHVQYSEFGCIRGRHESLSVLVPRMTLHTSK